MPSDRYKLVRPCANCPFRTDVEPYLREDRAVEISQSLASGCTFPCHKTTDLDAQDEDSDFYLDQGGEQFCAGALIMMEKMGTPNQIVRIAERTGAYDAANLDMDAPVVRNFDEFVAHHANKDEDAVEAECCHVVGSNCLAPAGYMMGGMVVPASFDPDDVMWCPSCGEATCTECMDSEYDGETVCTWCGEEEEE